MFILKDVQAVILDMDSTLVDSEKHWPTVNKELFKKYGIDFDTVEKDWFLHIKAGRPIVGLFDNLKKRLPQLKSGKEMFKERMELMFSVYQQRLEERPGATQFLKEVKKLGIPTAIASGMSPEIIKFVINLMNWQELIGDFASTHETEHKSKPEPDVWLLAARRLNNSSLNESLGIENEPKGVLSVKKAGMKCCAIPYPEVNRPEIEKIPGVWMADSLSDLLATNIYYTR